MKGYTVHKMMSPSVEEDRLVGRFFPQGTSAPTIGYPTKHRLWTVAWTSTGLWTVTITPKFFEWTPLYAMLQLASGAARYLQIGAISGQTFQIRNWDGAAVQDIAANANNSIIFEVSGQGSGS